MSVKIIASLRAEYAEATVRLPREASADYDPEVGRDRGPHVDRVGMIAVDTDPDHEDGR